jgi:HAE1 family hydrophobic/amphiphilic exporter-1
LLTVDGVAEVTTTTSPAAWTSDRSFAVVSVTRREHASPVNVSTEARKKLPPKAYVFYDEADYVKASEGNLTENIVSGTFLTLVCVLFFLRRLSSTLLVGAAIPLCVLLSIPFLYALGVTRNIMSLAGLALSVGIVVDASLSIVSDFSEHMATGRFRPTQAALRTLSETVTPLFVATLSTLAVFVPILFLSGRVGVLFSALSKAVIVSNIVGLLVSLVVVPAVLALLPARAAPVEKHSKFFESRFMRLNSALSVVLRSLLDMWNGLFRFCVATPARSAVFLAASGAAVVLAFSTLPPQEFLPLPRDGRGIAELDVVPASIRMPTPEQKETEARRLVSVLPQGIVQELDGRLLGTFDLHDTSLEVIRHNVERAFPGRPVVVALENPLRPLSAQSSDVTFFLDGPLPALQKLRAWLQSHAGVDTVRLSALEGAPVRVNAFDLSKEATVWAPKETHRRFLSGTTGSPSLALEGPARDAREPNVFAFVNGEPHTEGSVKLTNGLTTLVFEEQLTRYARDHGLALHESAESKEAKGSLAGLAQCLLLAIVIIFFILFMQNRSASKSLIILATFAWAPLGAIPALAWHDETLNGSALVGFILLAGTIVNNGILLMDRVEKKIHMQIPVYEAAREAVRERSLNVVVTGLTTVLAMAPMIWGGQEGAQMYRSLSIVVVYGTLASTPVSFLGIPALLIVRQGLVEARARWILKRRVATLARRLA